MIDEKALLRINVGYDKYEELCQGMGERTKPVLAMLEVLANRLAIAPASAKERFHAAFPGGLIEHSLKVYELAQNLNASFGANLDDESLRIACLFHDLGKVGDLTEDYYLPQDNDWRRDNLGEMYTVNWDIQKMPHADRSLWLLQHFGIQLTLDEWVAIKIHDGQYADMNEYYSMSEPTLALIVHMADRMSVQVEKGLI